MESAYETEVARIPPPYFGPDPMGQFLYRKSFFKGVLDQPIVILVNPIPVVTPPSNVACDCQRWYEVFPSERAFIEQFLGIKYFGTTLQACACNGEIIE